MNVLFNDDAKHPLIAGVNLIGDAVATTFGPNGKNVIIKNRTGIHVTKDGATVAKFVNHDNPAVSMGIDVIKDIAVKTAKDIGDGPQPLYSKVLTPTGWTTMGDLKIGDKICGTNKTIQEVIAIYPKGEKKIYNVIFDGERVVECCEDHLWNVFLSNRGTNKTLTTRQLIDSNKISKIQKDGSTTYGFYTPKAIVEFEEVNFSELLDPYLVGLLLGDGSLSGAGSIELSIGFKKEHVIEKIILPEGLSLTITKDDIKHAFRIKLKGIDNRGRTAKEIVEKLGLLGVKSETKFIPKKYLYSSYEQRLQLFQGLLDTDGYINDRGLFEFSTISKQLADDFLELVLSLGKETKISTHNRDKDLDSYSNTPIYRLYERKGYKYGIKLISIEETDKFTEMKCIKVSNSDHLYITDNYIITHNTTTSVILAREIVTSLMNSSLHPIEILRKLEEELKIVVNYLEENKLEISTQEDLLKVATLSANNDPILGKLISDTYYRVGKDGSVTMDDSPDINNSVVFSDGLQLDNGFSSPYFMNTDKNTCELHNVLVGIFPEKLTEIKQVLEICDRAVNEKKELLLFAPNFDSTILRMLLLNKGSKLESCTVFSPGNGIFRDILMNDIKVMLGDTMTCDKVIITRDTTTLIGCKITNEIKQQKIESIKTLLLNKELGEFEVIFHKKRLANYIGGVATILVGGYSKVEVLEKKDRVEDAIAAVKAALDGGVLPGGGAALIHAANHLQLELLDKIITEPFSILERSANIKNIQIGENFWDGYDFKKYQYGNMYEMGIIDPFLVTKTALENAVTAASLILTNGCSIINMD